MRLAHEARRAAVVDPEQQQRALVGRIERFPHQPAAAARHRIDAVEQQAGRARIGARRRESLGIGAEPVGAVEPRSGEAERQRHQAITSL